MDEIKTFLIPVEWTVRSTIRVEANSLQEAVDFAKEHINDIPITSDNEYIEDSYTVVDDDLENAQSYADISSIVLCKDGTII